MKLSEAIRAGAALRPQTYNELFENVLMVSEDGEVLQWCSCALGAAYEGYTGRDSDDSHVVFTRLYEYAPELRQPHRHPLTGRTWAVLEDVITGLNDEARWTREAIADWLEKEGL